MEAGIRFVFAVRGAALSHDETVGCRKPPLGDYNIGTAHPRPTQPQDRILPLETASFG